jgi:hypothetical protein
MTPTEARLLDIGRRYAALGTQAAQAFNDAQATLQLELVLSLQRLSTSEGTALSLQALDEFRRLLAAHKEAFRQLAVGCATEFASALAEAPEHERDANSQALVDTVNWHLDAQREFYENRERWIKAAVSICSLIESRRATTTFSESGIRFAKKADRKQFSRLVRVIAETHRRELEQMAERRDRLARAAAALGLSPGAS